MQQIASTETTANIPSFLASFASLSASQRKDDIGGDFLYTLWGHPHFEADFTVGSEASLSTTTPTSGSTPNHFEAWSTGNSSPPHTPTMNIGDLSREIASMFTLSPVASSSEQPSYEQALEAVLESAPHQPIIESTVEKYSATECATTAEVAEDAVEENDDLMNLVLTALVSLLQQETPPEHDEKVSAQAYEYDEAEYARSVAHARLEEALRLTALKHNTVESRNLNQQYQQLIHLATGTTPYQPTEALQASLMRNTYANSPLDFGYPTTPLPTQFPSPNLQHPNHQAIPQPLHYSTLPQAQQSAHQAHQAHQALFYQKSAAASLAHANNKRTHRPSPHAPPRGVPLPVYPINNTLIQPSTQPTQPPQYITTTSVHQNPTPSPFNTVGRIPPNHVVPSFQSLFLPNGAEPIVPVAPVTQPFSVGRMGTKTPSNAQGRKMSGSFEGGVPPHMGADPVVMQPKVVPPLPMSALTAARKTSLGRQGPAVPTAQAKQATNPNAHIPKRSSP